MSGRDTTKGSVVIVRGRRPGTYDVIASYRNGKGAFVVFDSSLSGTLTAFMLTGNTTTAKRGMAVFFAF